MEAVEGIPLKQLLQQSRGQSRLIPLPYDYLHYQHDWDKDQDVHQLPCVISGCERMCEYMHPVCNYHAKRYWHVELKRSTIPKAGRGVFICKSVRKGTHLMDYTGLIRDSEDIQNEYEANNSSSCYKITIDDHVAMDCRSTIGGLGRYINHSSNPNLVNCCFELDEENKIFQIVATRNIRVPVNGEVELLIDYGDHYWHDMKPTKPNYTQLHQQRRELMLRRMRGEAVFENYVAAEDWPVFPSYVSVVYNPEIIKPTRMSLKKLIKMSQRHRLLLPVSNQNLMDPSYFDLINYSQSIITMPCIVRNCNKVCQLAHPLCDLHLADFGLIVAKSTIPSAGNGLFITKSVPAGVTLMTFSGCYRNKNLIYNLYNKANAEFYYVFECAANYCIDARSSLGGIARLINHNPIAEEVNVELVSPAKDPTFFIRTTRQILVRRNSRVELFLNYGEQYWKLGRVCNCAQPTQRELPASSVDEAEPIDHNFACVPAYESIR